MVTAVLRVMSMDVIGGKEAVQTVAAAAPPARVDLFNMRDDIIRVERDLIHGCGLIVIEGEGCHAGAVIRGLMPAS